MKLRNFINSNYFLELSTSKIGKSTILASLDFWGFYETYLKANKYK